MTTPYRSAGFCRASIAHLALLASTILSAAATFPLPIPTRPTHFPLSRPAVLGTVAGWGENDRGQLDVPANLGPVVAVAACGRYSVALKQDGKLVAWGNISGDPAGYVPAQVPANLTGVVAIVGGDNSTTAIIEDGTVVRWSLGMFNELIVEKPSIRDVLAAADGDGHVALLKKDGTVVIWRGGDAVETLAVSDAVAIAAGFGYTIALKADGTVGVFGNASFDANVPSGLVNVVAVSTKQSHILALKSDGTVVAWGDNSLGQATVPAGLHDVVAVAAGGEHSLALKNDGTVAAWGAGGPGMTDPNGWHHLGQTSLPPGLSGVVAIGAGYETTMVLQAAVVAFDPELQIQVGETSGVDLKLRVVTGRKYRLQVSKDLRNWEAVGTDFLAESESLNRKLAAEQGGNYFRVIEVP